MIGKTEIKLGGKDIPLDFNLYAYEQLMNLLVLYADKGMNIDLNPETFDDLFLEVQRTSFMLACRMVIYAGHCGERLDKGKRALYTYVDIKVLVEQANQEELAEVVKFFWGTLTHEQEGEKKEQTPTSKKKVSVTKKSKQSV